MGEVDGPEVLLLDDGELGDVRRLLEQLECPYREADGFGSQSEGPSVGLLVSNARFAVARERPPCRLHLVVYKEISRTLRQVLDHSGADVVLQTPINPTVFRLLVNQAVYHGPERRRSRRVVLSVPIRVRAGLRSSAVTLAQLSVKGCGLVMERSPKLGARLRLTLPGEVTGGDSLELAGTVLRAVPVPGLGGRNEVSIAFEASPSHVARKLGAIVARHAGSPEAPATAAGAAESEPMAPGSAADMSARPRGVERRQNARKRFGGPVLAGGSGRPHALIGRDLSVGGMRVQPAPELGLGDELKLAVHARADLPAIMVRATVARDDGSEGLVLRFLDVPPAVASNLEQIIAALPDLAMPGRSRPGVIVSEVLGHG